MKTIIFDQTSLGWSKNDEINPIFLKQQKNYLEEKLKFRGYIYLNEVYEALGVKWHPDDENVCYRDGGDFAIDVHPTDNGVYRIDIH